MLEAQRRSRQAVGPRRDGRERACRSRGARRTPPMAARPRRGARRRASSLAAQELQTELATLLKLLKPAEGGGLDPDRRGCPHRLRLRGGGGRGARRRSRRRERRGGAGALARRPQAATRIPGLPAEATPLSQFVAAPRALERRLRQIGVVDRSVRQGAASAAQARAAARLKGRRSLALGRLQPCLRLGHGRRRASRGAEPAGGAEDRGERGCKPA